ncbi:hypothetical protein M0802_013919 [Mischocyttarus mexicanus]|nr:hypothetical protein M0802_013919 [Mischocyttarus mexicanus]
MNITEVPPIDKMANIYENSVTRFWRFLFHDLADPRTSDWFLLSSPTLGLSILIGYHYFIHSWGPKFMEHRKPFQLKNILVIYNFMQVLMSIWLCYESLDAAWLRNYSFKCEPVDPSNSPTAIRIARGVYYYFLVKMTELLDTVFFVLRKKYSQVTFLHVYHHTVMPMIAWGASKYYPGGHGLFVAALLPQYQKYLWWKRYITTLQMGQFCLVFLHNFQLLFYDCGYPRFSLIFTLPNVIFFYFLFSDFYKMSYESNNKNANTIETTTTENGNVESKNVDEFKENSNDYEDKFNISSSSSSSNGKIKHLDKGEKDD